MVISGAAMAEGEKLADKLSNSVIIVDIDVRGCEADSAILCPGLPLNSRKSFMCLMAYEDNLSLSCELGIAEAAMTLEQGLMAIDYSIKACEADADKFCLEVEPGEGRIVSCLKQNEAKLANQCVTALKETGLWNIDAQ
jgi:Cysteine rich repeat